MYYSCMHNYLTDTVAVLLASVNDVTCSFRKAMAVSMFVMEGGSRNGNLTGKEEGRIANSVFTYLDIMSYGTGVT